jgi:F-type H+-transporting ATPase subunit b
MTELLNDTNIWVLISFTLFAVLIYRLGKDKVLGMLDGKIERIRDEIKTAESLRIEAQELLAQYQRKQRDAAQEAEQIVSAARAAADIIRKDAEAELNALIARKETQLAERLKRMEDSARAEMQAYAAELAVKATAEIISSRLDSAANDRLIVSSIKSVAGQLK